MPATNRGWARMVSAPCTAAGLKERRRTVVAPWSGLRYCLVMSIDLPRPIPSIDVIEALPRRAADERISYGAGEFQFGDLWLPPPDTPQPFATAVFLHGGCWLARRSR